MATNVLADINDSIDAANFTTIVFVVSGSTTAASPNLYETLLLIINH